MRRGVSLFMGSQVEKRMGVAGSDLLKSEAVYRLQESRVSLELLVYQEVGL